MISPDCDPLIKQKSRSLHRIDKRKSDHSYAFNQRLCKINSINASDRDDSDCSVLNSSTTVVEKYHNREKTSFDPFLSQGNNTKSNLLGVSGLGPINQYFEFPNVISNHLDSNMLSANSFNIEKGMGTGFENLSLPYSESQNYSWVLNNSSQDGLGSSQSFIQEELLLMHDSWPMGSETIINWEENESEFR
jgi:hypothetical protein